MGRATVVTPRLQKVVIGIDDTDTKDEGATWTLAHNVGVQIAKQGYEYLDHVTVQLYPHNPNKTQNCVGIALVFAVKPGQKDDLVREVVKLLKKGTLSDKTAIAVLEGIEVPEKLKFYGEDAKKSMITLEKAENVAEAVGVELIEVTGSQGKIGALAALGMYDDIEEAVKVYY
ncbi:hypothetical protein GCM10025861_05240 [Methanobacterium petrolearium]|nr:hypothetical protein GCM10025861_05240 [Methanobacterium petrolearium]